MNKKQKIFNLSTVVSILAILIVTFGFSICLATGEDVAIESSEENYINSYEDYEALVGDPSTGYSQDELKYGYEEYQKEVKAYYEEYERVKTVRARVEEALEVKEVYEVNQYYYSFSKYEIQPITVRVLEGEHAGKTFSFEYLLTGDALNNVKYSKLKAGDVIFVTISVDETTGEAHADITNAGSNVERFGVLICIGLMAFLLLTIYGGKKGFIAGLLAVLVIDFCLILIPNMGYMGSGFVIAGLSLAGALIILLSLIELGLNKNAFKAIFISALMTIVTALLIMIGNYLTRTVGVTFEVAAVSENVILGNMNFESLYMIITLIIASFAITNVVCKAINKLDKVEAKGFTESLNACKDVLGTNVVYLMVMALVLYIPNHLLLLTNKYTAEEIWNAEILATELIRVFVIIISMSLAIPTVAIFNESKKTKLIEEKKIVEEKAVEEEKALEQGTDKEAEQ